LPLESPIRDTGYGIPRRRESDLRLMEGWDHTKHSQVVGCARDPQGFQYIDA